MYKYKYISTGSVMQEKTLQRKKIALLDYQDVVIFPL